MTEVEANKIDIARYCDCMRAWASVANRSDDEKQALQDCLIHLESQFAGVQKIEDICQAMHAWGAKNDENASVRKLRVAIMKSNLLARMIYGGESLRLVPCPTHKGEWSGCTLTPCPDGCSSGCDVTGWLPNDRQSKNEAFKGEGI